MVHHQRILVRHQFQYPRRLEHAVSQPAEALHPTLQERTIETIHSVLENCMGHFLILGIDVNSTHTI